MRRFFWHLFRTTRKLNNDLALSTRKQLESMIAAVERFAGDESPIADQQRLRNPLIENN